MIEGSIDANTLRIKRILCINQRKTDTILATLSLVALNLRTSRNIVQHQVLYILLNITIYPPISVKYRFLLQKSSLTSI